MENITILFVDDDQHLLDSLENILITEPYQKQFAISGNEALKIINSEPVHIIVTDMKMSEMDGLKLLQIVKKQYPDIVRIVLSGYVQSAQLIPCINSGEIYRYITKPVESTIFKQILRDAIEFYHNQHKDGDLLQGFKYRNEKLKLSLKKHVHIEKKLLELLPYDTITTLPNQNSFNDIIDKEWQRARRSQKPLSLIKIFLENYDDLILKFNQNIMNNWLKEAVEVSQKILKRPGDLLTRFNNNEFAIILPETIAEGAGKVAELIQHKIETLPLKQKENDKVNHFSISIGVATILPNRNDKEPSKSIITLANKALYVATKGGDDKLIIVSVPN